MKTRWLQWIIAVVAALGLTSTAAIAVAAKKAPDKTKIEACKKTKDPVTFEHQKHVDRKIECTKCHHAQKDLKAGADIEVKKCSECHLTPEKAETPKCTEMSMSKNPFHKLCITCHKADAAKKAPTKCTDCHKK
jgi:hypothetical protein